MVTNANAMARVGGGAAPAGMLADDEGGAGDGAPAFASVEEAMAVLERYKRKAAKKEAKKKDKKAKKERKKSERKEAKKAKHRGRSSSSSSSS
jgi:hypothetical protein